LSVGHPLGEIHNVGLSVCEWVLESSWWREVFADGPGVATGLVFGIEQPAHVQLGGVGMLSVLEDSSELGPEYEGVVFWEDEGGIAAIGTEGPLSGETDWESSVGDEVIGCLSASNKVNVLFLEFAHVFPSVLVNNLLEPEEDRIIIIWPGCHDLALEFGFQVVLSVDWPARIVREQVGVDVITENVDCDCVPVAVVLKLMVNLFPSNGPVVHKDSVVLPAGKVLDSLELDCISHE